MTVISASFHPFTIFRFARERGLQAGDLADELEEETMNLEMRLKMYLPAGALLKFWRGVHDILKVLAAGYLDLLKQLARYEWRWWRVRDRRQWSSLRARKESMIKSLVVYDWVLSLLQNAFASSFQEHRPWFLNSRAEHRQVDTVRRRFSYHDQGDYTAADMHEKAAVEMSIIQWTKFLEEQLLTSMKGMQSLYNNGKLFEHFICHVQWVNEEEERDWEQDEIKWPYPDCSLNLEELDKTRSKAFQRHAPVNEVPAWQEDVELRCMFS